jgi:hypothetical protein
MYFIKLQTRFPGLGEGMWQIFPVKFYLEPDLMLKNRRISKDFTAENAEIAENFNENPAEIMPKSLKVKNTVFPSPNP